mmetsp:Transcript_13915/g.20543  ORF Transcript_13915/g.20543 Transcript_13915/m.20543 type:complete len:111 (+) Transcript_13915:78-410(+)
MKSITLFFICLLSTPSIRAWIAVPPKSLTLESPRSLRNLVLNAEEHDGWGELSDLQQENRLSSVKEETQERDLFIPIFAIVSLAGLFGAYGYETLRLAANEELYLPWNNN